MTTTLTAATADLTAAVSRLRTALDRHPGRPRKYRATWPGWSEAWSLLRTIEQTMRAEPVPPADAAVYVRRIEKEMAALKRIKDPNAGSSTRSMQQITGYEPASTYDPSNPWACLND